MKGSRAEWIVLAVLLVVVTGTVSFLGGRVEEGPEVLRNASSYSERGSGSKGLYLWLQALGIPVRRWERPLRDLPREATLLMVLGPRLPVEGDELQALEKWVRAGGTLLLADDAVGPAVPGIFEGAPVLRFGLRPRPAGRPARLGPAFPSPYVEGVEAIEPEGRVRFQRETPEGWAPLFGDAAGDVVGVRRLGRGTVIAIADPGLFSNARLETAGHARLALNVVWAHARRGGPGPGGTVLVDEYHHGYGREDTFARYVRGTAVPWMLAQASLAFLALLLARGTRFGSPVDPPRAERASSQEYVAALGDLYRRAGARRLAAEALARGLRHELAAAAGMQGKVAAQRLAGAGARRLGLPEGQVAACLSPGPAAAETDAGLLRFAEAVHRLEERLRAPGAGRSKPEAERRRPRARASRRGLGGEAQVGGPFNS